VRARVNDVELSYEDTGRGDPLVLVHGSWVGQDTWDFVRPGLAESHRVVSYDRRGHSESERPAEQGPRSGQEDDLAALIEALDCAPAHVAANSFGGSIALGLAARRPELFRTLIVHEPPLIATIADDPELKPLMDDFAAKRQRVDERLEAGDFPGGARLFVEEIAIGPGMWELVPEEVRETMIANAPAYRADQRDSQWASIDTAGLAGFSAPTLLTHGEQSPPWFEKIAAKLAASMPSAQWRELAEAGHLPHLTNPGEYVATVSRFIREAP
jgi:pimeloyl-ACP methyl ester carboxylesterase